MAVGIGGELSWWCPSLDDTGNGTTTLYDLVGTRNGTLTDMDAATDWVADTASGGVRALDFDGNNDRVAIGTHSEFGSTILSISAWIKPSTTSGSDKAIVSQVNSAGTIGRAMRRSLTRITWTVANSGFRVWQTGTTITTDWQHIAISSNGINTPLIWRNGVAQTVSLAASSGTPTVPAAQELSIGYDGGFISTLYNFPGLIDDVRIFNTELTLTQVQKLASKRGYQPGVARCRLNDGLFNRGLFNAGLAR